MHVNIEFLADRTLITFKGGEVTDDLIGIVNGIAAGRYCFEASVLLSSEFSDYMTLVKNYHGDQFGIEVSNTIEPYIFWGRVKDGSIRSTVGEPLQKTWSRFIEALDALTPEDKQALEEVFDDIQKSRKVYCSECKKLLSEH